MDGTVSEVIVAGGIKISVDNFHCTPCDLLLLSTGRKSSFQTY